MKAAITNLAAKLRKQAVALTAHAARTVEQQHESAAHVDNIDAASVAVTIR
jgi:hypothetical protein